jgi:hypothetical protein
MAKEMVERAMNKYVGVHINAAMLDQRPQSRDIGTMSGVHKLAPEYFAGRRDPNWLYDFS